MDPKATAKSKRVHSLHGRRDHPTPSSVAARKKASASASAFGAHSKGDAPPPRRRPQLPSNWDRYDQPDDDPDSGASPLAMAPQSQILPKSKGADYRYLIEQARSQPQPVASSPEEAPFDFLRSSTSMLSARGEILLSLCEDDNFIVDDFTASSNFEVPFLSMDLNALAGQLAKLKMSQRLFVEDDLYGEEMPVSEPKDSQQPGRSATLDDSSNAHRESGSPSHISVQKVQSSTSTSEFPTGTDLDMLVGSFQKIQIPRGPEKSRDASVVFSDKIDASSFDDALDDLLAETSLLASGQILNSDSSKKEKIETLDESIDDLLGQSVIDVKKDNAAEFSVDVDVSSSSAPSKQVDDFDSWFDSL